MRLTLRREIIMALCVKLAAILALFFLFFGPSHRPQLDSSALAEHFLGKPDPVTRRHEPD